MKVFSRIIPFHHLGCEKDARVFIARTLEPGEPAPFTAAMATEQLQQQKAAAAGSSETPATMTEVGCLMEDWGGGVTSGYFHRKAIL
jgi:hypothetical protein